MIQGLVKAVVGVFGVASDESVQFYVDVLLGILSAITILIVVTLLLERRIGWMFAIAMLALLLCLSLAGKKQEVAAAALLFVAVRFLFAFLVSFRLSALLGVAVCVVSAGMALSLRKRTQRG